MKIVWDLDGVLRDLSGHIMRLHGGHYPDSWDYIFENGMGVIDNVNADLDILVNAPPTAYLSVLKKQVERTEIWTCQPEHWRRNTMMWISKHIGMECDIRYLTCEQKEEELKADGDIILIEDSPKFKVYDRILLIDRPYNQRVNAMRIYGTKNLTNMIEVVKGV